MLVQYQGVLSVFRFVTFEKLDPMKRRTIASIGGIQPLLFCVGMYLAALFFSMFICSSIFYAINPKKGGNNSYMEKTASTSTAGKEVLASIK